MLQAKRSRYTTQEDVARLAKVSRAAVGAALGTTDRIQVSEKTRQAVLEAARKLNYVPHESASATRRGRTEQIGIIWPRLRTYTQSLYASELSYRLSAMGYKMTLRVLEATGLAPEVAWDQLLSARVEGIFIVSALGSISSEMQKKVINSPVPVVSLSGPSFPGVPVVAGHAEDAFYQLTRHLIETGRKRLVLMQIERLPDFNTRSEWKHDARKAGFLRAVREAGLESSCETFVFKANWKARGFGAGMQALDQLLEQRGGEPPEGIVCNNDHLAVGVLRRADERGIAVPQQMAVTGFDGEPWAAYGTTPLTTAIQPHAAMAQTAVDHFKLLLAGKPLPTETHYLPCEVVFRKSSKMF